MSGRLDFQVRRTDVWSVKEQHSEGCSALCKALYALACLASLGKAMGVNVQEKYLCFSTHCNFFIMSVGHSLPPSLTFIHAKQLALIQVHSSDQLWHPSKGEWRGRPTERSSREQMSSCATECTPLVIKEIALISCPQGCLNTKDSSGSSVCTWLRYDLTIAFSL